MAFDYEKFKTLVHHVCYKADHEDLGAIKLNKTLWYSDTNRYIETGASITGETYVKREFGPASQHILQAIADLVREGKIAVRNAEYFGYNKKEYVALKRPDLSCFSAGEISLADDMIQMVCCGHTAKSISLVTHDEAYNSAAMNEEMPYCSVLLRPEPLTSDDLTWADEAIAKWRTGSADAHVPADV